MTQVQHQLVQPRRVQRVQPGGWFVEVQKLGVQRQRARNRRAFAHAARELRRLELEGAVQADQRQLVARLAFAFTRRHRAEQAHRQHQVLAHGHRAPQGASLEHHAEAAAQLRFDGFTAVVQVVLAITDAAAGRRLQADEVAQQGALAAAAGADDDEDFATADVEFEPVLHQLRAVAQRDLVRLHERVGVGRGGGGGGGGGHGQYPRLWNTAVVADAAITIHSSAFTTAAVVASPTACAFRPE